MTSSITAQNLETVARFLKGRRLEKLMASIEILRAAEARGVYEGRESVKALAGFGPGLAGGKKFKGVTGTFADDWARHRAESCVRYGQPYAGVSFAATGVPQEVTDAWVQLCGIAHKLHQQLKAARPKPVITAIGLSPKVTKTLTEMNLDLDLPSITPAKIEAIWEQGKYKNGAPMIDWEGKPIMVIVDYIVRWTPGTKFGKSRFYAGCQACGKPIPSGQYVPIEANCRKNGRIGLWIGCDCARNIFGVKDQGVKRSDA